MLQEQQISSLVEKIEVLKSTAETLAEISEGIPAVERNANRTLACIRLLELNITDVAGLLDK